jgi:glycosyltransferase AglD
MKPDHSERGISLVIPFYNEAVILESTLNQVWDFVTTLDIPFELILADDGSRDPSVQCAEQFVATHPGVRLVRNAVNEGRGSVLTKAFSIVSMPVAIYIDADLEIGIPFLKTMVRSFDDSSVKVCTGSKVSGDKQVVRSWHRQITTRIFNALIRRCLNSPVSDHQCGLKGFRKETLVRLLPGVKEKGWAWDTEMLLVAQKQGLKIHEFPVQVESKRKSTVRLFRTTCMFLSKMVEFRKRGLAL